MLPMPDGKCKLLLALAPSHLRDKSVMLFTQGQCPNRFTP
jgi:hypothetical protein